MEEVEGAEVEAALLLTMATTSHHLRLPTEVVVEGAVVAERMAKALTTLLPLQTRQRIGSAGSE